MLITTMALCEDGFTWIWLWEYVDLYPRATNYHVRKYFIEPISDEL